jgi:hypothetical protein
MEVLDALFGEARRELLLREPRLAGDGHCTDVSQLPDTGRLQRSDEPINVGTLLANCEEYTHPCLVLRTTTCELQRVNPLIHLGFSY